MKSEIEKKMKAITKKLWVALTAIAALSVGDIMAQTASKEIIVPISGNTWQSPKETKILTREDGIKAGDKDSEFATYVRFATLGTINLAVQVGEVKESASIKLSVGNQVSEVQVNPQQSNGTVAVGDFAVQDTGYVAIKLSGNGNQGLPTIQSYRITGNQELINSAKYVADNEGNYFYWGRRGPSVHLSYTTPADKDIEYCYNEITVPEGEDVVGSYYMANGFGEGYFGIQVNSATERRILFSVWSPFHTDNPKEIPDDEKILLTAKGADVYTGEFGNEGSGGQSFLRYNWITGNTYKFLLRGRPIANNYTEYTAWVFAPEKGDWQLIAQFQRPKTNTYLKRFHSFLENFIPSQGNLERHVRFANQWVRDVNGKWHECTQAKFTADATARKAYRLDYDGGVKGNDFYLRNCGFFADYTAIGSEFERVPNGQQPNIDVETLPLQ